MKIRKIIIKITPYLMSAIAGIFFYILSIVSHNRISTLFLDIAGAFFAIPLIFLFYQSIDNFSKKKLNVEIFDYCKLGIDREILSIINQVQKIIYPLEERDNSLSGINNFIELTHKEVDAIIAKNQYLGFQVFKHWDITEKNIEDILKHPLLINNLHNEQLSCIILMLKNIYSFSKLIENKDLYIETGKSTNDFILSKGSDINEQNSIFPDRYLLLKKIKGNKFLVSDFGDIHPYNINKCLNFYMVNPEYCQTLALYLYSIINSFREWGLITGKEFVIDTKIFRIANIKPIQNTKSK